MGEGYGICDIDGIIGHSEYFDYGEFGDSGNWNPATLVSQDPKSVKIARTTSDGIWTLTQTITQVRGAAPPATIAMTITNNTDAERSLVIFRYANVNADGVLQNNLDSTLNSAFGWNSISKGQQIGFGLMLQNVGATRFPHFAFKLNTPQPPLPCNAFVRFVKGPITNTDGSIVVDYAMTLGANESRTVTVAYKGM